MSGDVRFTPESNQLVGTSGQLTWHLVAKN
jgi:hypothetical protein